MAILNIYKPIGWTPLQCIDQIRIQMPEYKSSPMTYAGRLDPMAEGVLVVLTDEDRHNKNDFLHLDKTYEAEFLFGFESDSYDLLGLAQSKPLPDESKVISTLEKLKGEHVLPFPSYSSFKVQGKPLHWWTQQNKLDEIEIPTKQMTVLDIQNIQTQTLDAQTFLKNTLNKINAVQGDFRQDQINDRWKSLLQNQSLLTATLALDVTSGTYIRSLAHYAGQQLESGCLLSKLKRTKVGTYSQDQSIILNQ
jgi:tRNA pseudouridine55 synthase